MGQTGEATPNLQTHQVRWTPTLDFHISSFHSGKILFYYSCPVTTVFFYHALLRTCSTTEHCFMAPKCALHLNLVAGICTVCGVGLLLLGNAQVPQLVPVIQFTL